MNTYTTSINEHSIASFDDSLSSVSSSSSSSDESFHESIQYYTTLTSWISEDNFKRPDGAFIKGYRVKDTRSETDDDSVGQIEAGVTEEDFRALTLRTTKEGNLARRGVALEQPISP
eukprot:Nitzschia sp. Nitz4//scaffold417_size9038//1206//1556//NITZ4_009105-RA/size9038-processed-gene-0.12-mRNA-1//-1//CDS//3329551371//1572//frame0